MILTETKDTRVVSFILHIENDCEIWYNHKKYDKYVKNKIANARIKLCFPQ